jgi:hypothetical protein
VPSVKRGGRARLSRPGRCAGPGGAGHGERRADVVRVRATNVTQGNRRARWALVGPLLCPLASPAKANFFFLRYDAAHTLVASSWFCAQICGSTCKFTGRYDKRSILVMRLTFSLTDEADATGSSRNRSQSEHGTDTAGPKIG